MFWECNTGIRETVMPGSRPFLHYQNTGNFKFFDIGLVSKVSKIREMVEIAL